MSTSETRHFDYIDSVRGFAVALVILCHATYLLPELPYPVHRITVLGWHGVQLFFLASTITLMMSWQQEIRRKGKVNVGAFFLRRFFRIAPAYYLASILYFVLKPPAGGFDPLQALGTYAFVNAWHPGLMAVAPDAWNPVPGSWSIGVEFTFYAVLPFLAAGVSNLGRALALLVVTLGVGMIANPLVYPLIASDLGATPADNFVYFWFPNQMSVFALGFCLYHLMQWDSGRQSVFACFPNTIAAGALALFMSVTFLPLPHWLTWQVPLPPAFIYASVAFMIFMLAMARAPAGLFVNPVTRFMGRISFSAYLVHEAVISQIGKAPVLQGVLVTSGWKAIPLFGALMIVVYAIVAGAAWISYRLIESPMIAAGKSLINRRLPRQAPRPA